MAIELLTDHASRALARLAMQYRGTASHEGILAALGAQVQELERAIFDLLLLRSLEGCEGVQLDNLGKVLGAAREGRADTDYRLRLRAQIVLNRSSGEAEVIAQVFRLTVPASTAVEVVDIYPAAFESSIRGVAIDEALAEKLAAMLRQARAGGVQGTLRYVSTGGEPAALVLTDDTVGPTSTLTSYHAAGIVNVYLADVSAFPDTGTILINPTGATAECLPYISRNVPGKFVTLQFGTSQGHNSSEVVELQTTLGLARDGVATPWNAGNLAGARI